MKSLSHGASLAWQVVLAREGLDIAPADTAE